ncbi:hypothetical protein J3458_019198 [Metarhizium acridum]|uniref:uncharacterized protein n=1 Tax=Metarhizium acridum TaxID=92637 RepID=UPI001C6C2567|nr:hypothetical protein J3458_019198 [Metarhizium acridum]
MHGGKKSLGCLPVESTLLSTNFSHLDLEMARMSGRSCAARAKTLKPGHRAGAPHPEVLPHASLARWAVNQQESRGRREATHLPRRKHPDVMWTKRTAARARERLRAPKRPKQDSKIPPSHSRRPQLMSWPFDVLMVNAARRPHHAE